VSETPNIQLLKLKRELLRKSAISGSFIDFVYYVKAEYIANWHHIVVANKLQDFLLDESKRCLAVFMPPQNGKSELTSRMFPAFALGINPDLKVSVSSYSSDLSDSFNRDIQKIIDSEFYAHVFPNTKLNSKNVVTTQNWLRNSEIFEIVNHQGSLKSVGVGGGLTGRPVDLAIIDDPIKDDMEAQSSTFREKVWQWYLTVLSTRLHNKSKQILIMTRWHEDDLAGRLLNPEINPFYHEWEVIKIPAIMDHEKTEYDKREIGDPLWPERHSLENTLRIKSQSDSVFESLYQQNPVAKAGNKVKREWFVIVDSLPNKFLKRDLWIDGAYTDKAQNDPTGLITVVYDDQTNTLYVLNAHDERMEMPKLMTFIPTYANLHGLNNLSRIYIEPKASGKSIAQLINSGTKLSAIEIKSYLISEGKEARLQVASPYIEAAKVKLIRGHWNEKFINQISGFPNTKHDEYVDLIGYACEFYFRPKAGAYTFSMGHEMQY